MPKAIAFAAAMVLLVCPASTTLAADYPTKPITLMIGFAPGGPSDVMARILTRKMEEILKQPFVIENRAGAGGGLAGTAVARAAPDGYTVLLATGSLLAINVSLYQGQPGQAELRLRRQRDASASRGRAAQDRGQSRHDACSIPGDRPGVAGRHRRARADGV